MSRKIVILDERGVALNLTGRTVATLYGNLDGSYEVHLGPEQLPFPVVDETWTKADVRKLLRLIEKRANLTRRIRNIGVEERAVEEEAARAIRQILQEW